MLFPHPMIATKFDLFLGMTIKAGLIYSYTVMQYVYYRN